MLVCVDDWPRALAYPQLEILDHGSLLFVARVREGAVIAVAVLEAPLERTEPIVRDHDITRIVIERLGCPSVGEFARWAATPRVLTATDVDVLMYELQLWIESLPPAPELVIEDARGRELREAVSRDPVSDEPRAVYADYLQDLGDPRGELIALQLERARTAGRKPSERERELVRRFGARCAEPLTRWLESGYLLERGFLSKCVVNDHKAMPPEIMAHPAWSTVEGITTDQQKLLESRALVSVKRVASGKILLGRLAARTAPVPFEVVVGELVEPRRGRPVNQALQSLSWERERPAGLSMERSAWNGVTAPGSLARLRVLSVRGQVPERVSELIRSELGTQLEHLDVITDGQPLAPWRVAYDRAQLPLLSFRFWATELRSPQQPPAITDRIIALARDEGETRVIVEVAEPVGGDTARELLRSIEQISRGIRVVELRDLGEPARIAERQAALRDLLASVFPVVRLRETAVRTLEP